MKEVVDRFTDELKRDAKEEIKRLEGAIEQKIEGVKEYLEGVSKIALPVDLIDILARGGFVKSWEIEKNYDTDLQVYFNGVSLEMIPNEYTLTLKPGKYRITLVVERTK